MSDIKFVNPTIFPEITKKEYSEAQIYFNKLGYDRCPFCSHVRLQMPNIVNTLLRKKWSPRAIVEFIQYGAPGTDFVTSKFVHDEKKYPIPDGWRNNVSSYLRYGVLYHIAFCRHESYEDYAIKHMPGYLSIKNDCLKEERQKLVKKKPARTKKELKKGLSVSIPELISNQLLIFQMEQDKYLRGEISTPPDINTINKILSQLEKLIGSHEIADIIE